MKKHSIGEVEKGDAVRIVSAQALGDRMNRIRSMIAKRAYELYERREMADGGDLNYWSTAEREILHPCRHDLRESEGTIILRAEIPGSYTADQLQISVEPGRLMVSGEREVEISYWDGRKTRTDRQPQRIFRSHDLPAEIDASRASAILANDVLTVTIPKLSHATAMTQAARSAG